MQTQNQKQSSKLVNGYWRIANDNTHYKGTAMNFSLLGYLLSIIGIVYSVFFIYLKYSEPED